MIEAGEKHTRWKRRLRIALQFQLAIILSLVAAGVTYQTIGEWRDAKRFPPQGQLVDAGGHRLSLYCTGQGSPAVVLESGLGVLALGWALVQPGIAKTTRVCSYDRGGYGSSEPGPTPRVSSRIASELHTLLRNAGVPAPYILVGHSLGGYNVRVFANRFPREVAGLVLVDSSHEDQTSRMSPKMRAENGRRDWQQVLAPWMARLGIIRALPSLVGLDKLSQELPGFPPEVVARMTALSLRSDAFAGAFDEMSHFEQSADEVRKCRNFGDLPLTVLTACKLFPGAGQDFVQFHKIWVEQLQVDLARLSTRGRQIKVEQSGHMIPIEQPGAIVSAVREMVDGVRAR